MFVLNINKRYYNNMLLNYIVIIINKNKNINILKV